MGRQTNGESRRKFLKVVPTAVAGAVAAKAYAQGPPQNTGPVTADIVRRRPRRSTA